MSKLFAVISLACLILVSGCSETEISLGSAAYADAVSDPECLGSNPGGIVDVDEPGRGIDYSLRTPENYKADVRHPLLVVFPAAGHNNFRSEVFTQFTYPATTAGMVVLYPSHQPLRLKTIKAFARVIEDVASNWCIDQKQVYFTGHSDGGTVTHLLAQSEDLRLRPAAIAPSAAGIRADDLVENGCLNPVSTLLMHNSKDKLFPGFGRDATNWWVKCNQCMRSVAANESGCVLHTGCAGGTEVMYCEVAGGHRDWLQPRQQILEFLMRQAGASQVNVGKNDSSQANLSQAAPQLKRSLDSGKEL